MSNVVPWHKLNKYGGVFTSEIRDNRRARSSIAKPDIISNDLGRPAIKQNPATSSFLRQQLIYQKIFKTYS